MAIAENTTLIPGHVECEKKLDEYLTGWKRALADYQNLKKTVEESKTLFNGWKDEAWASELIPVVDHWSQATQHIPHAAKKDPWVQGVLHIERELNELLKAHGVERYESVGQPFDPMMHEPVESQAAGDGPKGIVLREVAAGYRMHGRVLRPARVVVSE